MNSWWLYLALNGRPDSMTHEPHNGGSRERADRADRAVRAVRTQGPSLSTAKPGQRS